MGCSRVIGHLVAYGLARVTQDSPVRLEPRRRRQLVDFGPSQEDLNHLVKARAFGDERRDRALVPGQLFLNVNDDIDRGVVADPLEVHLSWVSSRCDVGGGQGGAPTRNGAIYPVGYAPSAAPRFEMCWPLVFEP